MNFSNLTLSNMYTLTVKNTCMLPEFAEWRQWTDSRSWLLVSFWASRTTPLSYWTEKSCFSFGGDVFGISREMALQFLTCWLIVDPIIDVLQWKSSMLYTGCIVLLSTTTIMSPISVDVWFVYVDGEPLFLSSFHSLSPFILAVHFLLSRMLYMLAVLFY